MAEPTRDEWLTAVLTDIGTRLATTTSDVMAPGATEAAPAAANQAKRFPRHRARPLLVVLAAAAVLLAFALVLVTPVRESVADWLGIGSTSVHLVPTDQTDPRGLPALDSGLDAVTARAAARELGAPLPDTSRTELGAPKRIAIPPEGGVVLAWARGGTTLWIRPTEPNSSIPFEKLLPPPGQFTAVEDLGEAAALITGDHLLITPYRRVRARTTLIWLTDGFEYRLESDLDPPAMIEIARAVS